MLVSTSLPLGSETYYQNMTIEKAQWGQALGIKSNSFIITYVRKDAHEVLSKSYKAMQNENTVVSCCTM